MNSKKLGDLGLGRAISYFARLGLSIAIPLTDSQDYDLVVEFPDGLKKIQVKFTSCRCPSGAFIANLNMKGGTKGRIWKWGDQIVFDYLFVATSDGSDWLVPRSAVNKNITLSDTNKNSIFRIKAA